MLLKIGELARRTGLTVRTLHHYDAIGLLRPSGRSPAGYRQYDRNDIARLHRIQALRRLDVPLAEIAALLDGGGADLQTVIDEQIAALEQQIARAETLRHRLLSMRGQLRSQQEPALDDWLATLAMMHFYDRYLTPQELERLQQSGQADHIAFHGLKEQLRARMEAGTPADHPDVLALAQRWLALSTQTLAHDARLIHRVDGLLRQDPDAGFMTNIDAPLLDYITRATAEFRLSLYARHIDATDFAAMRERFLRHYLEWPALLAEARELHERDTDPAAPAAQDLAARWMALVVAVWGSDPAVLEQLQAANAREPELLGTLGIGDGAMQLVRRSLDHLKQQAQQQKETI